MVELRIPVTSIPNPPSPDHAVGLRRQSYSYVRVLPAVDQSDPEGADRGGRSVRAFAPQNGEDGPPEDDQVHGE